MKSGSGKRKRGGRDWEERSWGNCGWRGVYERRINNNDGENDNNNNLCHSTDLR